MPDFPPGAENVRSEKIALRKQLLTRRQALPVGVRHAAGVAVLEDLRALIHRLRPRLTAAYVPVGSEPGGTDLPEQLTGMLGPDARLLLPVLRTDLDLDWAGYDGPGTLTAGPHGLREPAGGRLGVSAVGDAELVIVPALAVDRHGVRMGRGGGSYDRTLARTPDALTVALLHDGELLDAVPAEPHDRPVRAAITPRTGLRVFGEAEVPRPAGPGRPGVTPVADPGWTK